MGARPCWAAGVVEAGHWSGERAHPLAPDWCSASKCRACRWTQPTSLATRPSIRRLWKRGSSRDLFGTVSVPGGNPALLQCVSSRRPLKGLPRRCGVSRENGATKARLRGRLGRVPAGRRQRRHSTPGARPRAAESRFARGPKTESPIERPPRQRQDTPETVPSHQRQRGCALGTGQKSVDSSRVSVKLLTLGRLEGR